MSQKINTTTIGLFIVTGLALGVTGLLLFSSSKLFTNSMDCIVYFDQSLSGLSEGADVKFRGVKVGSVKRVMVRFNQATNDYAMPVIFQVEEQLLRQRMGDEGMEFFTEHALAGQIQGGLRATLESDSLVTGILYIGIHPVSHAPPPVFHQLEEIYPEFPSQPTEITQLMNQLASLDIKSIEKNVNSLLVKLDTTIDKLDITEINAGITNLLVSVDRFISSPEIPESLAALRATLAQYRLLGEKLNHQVDPLADSVTNSLAQADLALAQIGGAAEHLRTWVAPDASLRVNLDQALRQLAAVSQSLDVLLEFLKQHPNALIAGRKTSLK